MAFFICNFIPVPSFTDILNKGRLPLIPMGAAGCPPDPGAAHGGNEQPGSSAPRKKVKRKTGTQTERFDRVTSS
jgi:hypothetical protein